MKKKLIDAIKAKFVGIDEDTAKRLAERAFAKNEAITNDDEVAAAVEAITLTDVLKSVNDFSANEAVKRYEEKYGLEKGEKKVVEPKPNEPPKPSEPKPTEPPKPAGGDDIAATMKSLLEEFKKGMTEKFDAVSNELAAIKTGKLTETRRAALDNAIKDLKDFQKKPYSRYQLDSMSEDEFNNLLSEVKEEVSDILAENRASESRVSPALGGHHATPNNGNVKEATKEEIDALVAKFPSL